MKAANNRNLSINAALLNVAPFLIIGVFSLSGFIQMGIYAGAVAVGAVFFFPSIWYVLWHVRKYGIHGDCQHEDADNEKRVKTVAVNGVVDRCGFCPVPVDRAIMVPQAVIKLKNSQELFLANATEDVALIKPGDELTLVVKAQVEKESEKRFAFKITNHSIK